MLLSRLGCSRSHLSVTYYNNYNLSVTYYKGKTCQKFVTYAVKKQLREEALKGAAKPKNMEAWASALQA